MGDWQDLIQSVVIGLLFSYLLAKLISVVVSFKDENLTITRHVDENYTIYEAKNLIDASSDEFGGVTHDLDSLIGEHGSVRNESLPGSDVEEDNDDDDWEDVETTELDEVFSAATAFVATAAADRLSHKLSNDVQLLLYGWYKIATEGPCSSPQPSALKMTARAKWQAWQKLGAMPPEDAMQKYIDTVTELYPAWLSGSSMKKKTRDTGASSRESKEPMGPVFSSFVHEEEGENELKMDAIHGFAREGQMNDLLKCIEDGVSVDLKDSEGRTPLHWAVDRGHLSIVEKLVGKNADVNTKDCEGQTPLHYAAVCEREVIAEFLVKHNAKTDVKDDNGDSPRDICDLKWPFMDVAAQQMQE